MSAAVAVAPTPAPLLPQPDPDAIALPSVMAALSDPIRLTILHRYLVDGDGSEQACGWVGIDRPKSTLTHHFRVLREAGLLEQRQDGLERRSRVRTEVIAARFPGVLDLVRTWQVPPAVLLEDLPPLPAPRTAGAHTPARA
ncbi:MULTISPECIES: helix-turn-helix transcriptional regulator [unclassified Curtobacterium]|uniref:ArsR/SmtB family transcription factor n=1 Tax=unclassified Curtobacterium TaxID=257496 RepID=UPI000DA8EE3F|nr:MULTISPECIES: helix-turn-helix domain-containing protein [unclassified Curtobacterium]PZE23347.1 ArsR family transcriptional regulator [Curtobacterium sp. MCBD17_028]PZE74799.1 ArsR family transcriptional regulator [Curtobacterium sp. MCBD17_019]WIB63147.1 helix-turn-helix domain-containing protein [Curtobacterium sp. MCBD17_040]WIB66990.1 helix-turn-helix domain-containing protein [Curtobacterium sp. MCBD17_035]WIE54129.1 helix-turn-helix domain-containing protein [Curtobacterium sp. MCBD1